MKQILILTVLLSLVFGVQSISQGHDPVMTGMSLTCNADQTVTLEATVNDADDDLCLFIGKLYTWANQSDCIAGITFIDVIELWVHGEVFPCSTPIAEPITESQTVPCTPDVWYSAVVEAFDQATRHVRWDSACCRCTPAAVGASSVGGVAEPVDKIDLLKSLFKSD